MTGDTMRRPSPWLRDLEGARAIAELAALATSGGVLSLAPRGDGHGVLVLPGFMTSDEWTWPLRDLLRRLGYQVRPWDLGRNLGPTSMISRGIVRRLKGLHEETGGRVSLVGMSLGGVLAREVARTHPDFVRQVISLGSPFARPPDTDPALVLDVPSTAIFTRTDGIVPWETCIQPRGPRSESVEVWGSHAGLAHNPISLAVVADRLALPEETWEPFDWGRLPRHLRRRAAGIPSRRPPLMTKDAE